MEAFAFGGTETPPNWAGEEEGGVQVAFNLPGRFLQAHGIRFSDYARHKLRTAS
jgi:hypothetical protein